MPTVARSDTAASVASPVIASGTSRPIATWPGAHSESAPSDSRTGTADRSSGSDLAVQTKPTRGRPAMTTPAFRLG